MKRAILHIGMPKTGSTSLQKLLHDNRERLARLGINYPQTRPWPPISHGELARMFYGKFVKRKNLHQRVFEHLEKRIDAGGGDTLILSSEALYEMHGKSQGPQAICSFLNRLGYSVQVIVFIRPQAEYLNSKYAQVVRALVTPDRFEDYFLTAMKRPELQYGNRLRNWGRLKGVRLSPIPYSHRVREEGAAVHFFKVAGLDTVPDEFDLGADANKRNPTSGPLTAEAFRRLASGATWRRNSDAVAWAQRELLDEAEALGWEKHRFSGLTDELRSLARAYFHDRNDRFAKRFWKQSWDDVFEQDANQKEEPNDVDNKPPTPEQTADLERVVRQIHRRYANLGPFGEWMQRMRLRLNGKSAINRRTEDLFRLDDAE